MFPALYSAVLPCMPCLQSLLTASFALMFTLVLCLIVHRSHNRLDCVLYSPGVCVCVSLWWMKIISMSHREMHKQLESN